VYDEQLLNTVKNEKVQHNTHVGYTLHLLIN